MNLSISLWKKYGIVLNSVNIVYVKKKYTIKSLSLSQHYANWIKIFIRNKSHNIKVDYRWTSAFIHIHQYYRQYIVILIDKQFIA